MQRKTNNKNRQTVPAAVYSKNLILQFNLGIVRQDMERVQSKYVWKCDAHNQM